MLGRGQRARGSYSGCVFVKYQESMVSSIEKKMKAETKFDFKDGANNLRLMSSMKDAIDRKGKNLPTWQFFSNKVGKSWVSHRDEFVGLLDSGFRPAINTLYNELKDHEHSDRGSKE